MSDYDFKALSPHEFEQLSRDALQEKLGVLLESFRSGRDDGIDLRYAADSDDELIVQCKHYARSTVDKLLRDLRREEAPKVRRLAPKRYVLVTSLGLTPKNKRDIAAVFDSFCPNVAVYGASDLNNLLGLFPDVERRHYKLWLTSTTVLERVLHAGIHNSSRVELELMQRKLRLYVQNASFPRAEELLERFGFVVVAGIPGIGKTTLAEALVTHYIAHGYEAYKVYNASQVYDVLKPDAKQVFFYDDFLGQTAFEPGNVARGEDRQLLSLLRHVSERAGHVRLIFTTRDYILEQARSALEGFDRSGLNAARCVVDLKSYTRAARAEILYNHLYFAELPEDAIKSILRNRTYLAIIDHPHYSPRIIEVMTTHHRFRTPDAPFAEAFLSLLDHPEDLWRTAFEKHVSTASQYLLLALAFGPPRLPLPDLQRAFEPLYADAARDYGFRRAPTDFKAALRELDGTFISSMRSREGSAEVVVDVHNPSVRDFLEGYLAEHGAEVRRLCRTTPWFETLQWLWGKPGIGGLRSGKPVPLPPRMRRHLLEAPQEFVTALQRTLLARAAGTTENAPLAPRALFLHELRRSGFAPESVEPLLCDALNTLKSERDGDGESLPALLRLARALRDPEFTVALKTHLIRRAEAVLDVHERNDGTAEPIFRAWLDFRAYFPNDVQEAEDALMQQQVLRTYPGWTFDVLFDRAYGDVQDEFEDISYESFDDEDGERWEPSPGSDEAIDDLFSGLG